ncbi:MAG: methionine--tRNA ligase, partial [Betaproteobacteria bacterium]|nr:methionine--tRNA ligase [Betaproteobacteria bacterium]
MKRRILVTSALPYANGSIHFGHLVEYIQTDIWVRFQKMQGHEVHWVCADDTHGTPVMLRAQQEGVTPEQLIARMHTEHQRDFNGFHIGFDNYHTTHSPENRALCEDIYRKLVTAKLIEKRAIEQYYDPVKNMFLPDRFIKGECPKCHAKDQYGDACEVCGSAYAPTDLVNPYSAVSGAAPVKKQSDHYFFRLGKCEEFLRRFVRSPGTLQHEAANKLDEWFKAGLADWDISRDAPYFGFEIPDAPGKYFYVWLDAPIGYLASFKNLCRKPSAISSQQSAGKQPLDFAAFTDVAKAKDENTEMIHFIGKDILYFHALFWPAMLDSAKYRVPTRIYAHGFLTVNGEKMSKSRGTFITAESYLALGLNPEWLRYYYAAKLNNTMEDIDLSFDDFVARVNSDLVGKFVNIASRCATFITRRFGGKLVDGEDHKKLQALMDARFGSYRPGSIRDFYEQREFGKVTRYVMDLADEANKIIDEDKPWEIAKDPGREAELLRICSLGLNLFKILTTYLKPILPRTAKEAESLLNIEELRWPDPGTGPVGTLLLPPGHVINPYHHLIARVDPKQITALIAANTESLQPAPQPHSQQRHAEHQQHVEKAEIMENTISIDDFTKVDLRIAKIVNAERVEGAD